MRFLTVLCLTVPLLAQSPAQSPTIPSTPAGNTLKAWLEAFNSHDRAKIEAFDAKYSPGRAAQEDIDFSAQTGGFDLLSIDKSERLNIEFHVREKNSPTVAAGGIDVTDADPGVIVDFRLRAVPAGAPANAAPLTLDAAQRGRVIDGAITNLNDYYVFPDVAKKMEALLRERQKSGAYDSISDGGSYARTLTDDLQSVSHDKHLRVNFAAGGPGGPGPDGGGPDARKMMERSNCAFEKVERLPSNIGYLKFNGFMDPQFCSATASAAMNFLGNVDALIVDLRENGGGDPAMVAYITSYLFAERTHLNDLWTRKGNSTEEFWTNPNVPGKKLAGKPVFVLAAKRTFSGAEEFTYNLKNLKRATIIGETTGGGAHPVSGHRIDANFMIGVPFARAINPYSKTNWEGTGVEPDVKVPAAEALDVAKKMAAEQVGAASASTPAARLFHGWLAAFNGGHRDEILAFYKEHYPSRIDRIDWLMSFREDTGGFDFRKEEASTPTSFTALVKERNSDQFALATLEMDSGESGHIKSIPIRGIPPPPGMAPARLSEAEVPQQFGAKLDEWAAADKFSGAALVARNGKPAFSAFYGFADRENKVPNKLTTRFRMGSMNKMFTATSILQLVQAGKIKLDDPLGKYLPDYPNKDVATKVTIHHLLTHTGGTGDFFGPEFDKHRLELKTLNDYVKLYGARGLAFEPGAKWEYSNYGFLLLGIVVEKASGQDYYDYVRDHIFKPAGMTGSGSEPENVNVPERSKGYMTDNGKLVLNTDTLPYRGTSAGGGYTTVEDLLRFATALTTHKLLDAHHTALLTTGKVAAGNGKYAYGFQESEADGVRSFGHSGGAPGMNGELRIYPESGYVVAVLVNMDNAASRASQWIGARLPAK